MLVILPLIGVIMFDFRHQHFELFSKHFQYSFCCVARRKSSGCTGRGARSRSRGEGSRNDTTVPLNAFDRIAACHWNVAGSRAQAAQAEQRAAAAEAKAREALSDRDAAAGKAQAATAALAAQGSHRGADTELRQASWTEFLS